MGCPAILSTFSLWILSGSQHVFSSFKAGQVADGAALQTVLQRGVS